MQIIVYYNKKQKKNGTVITIRVGNRAIHTDKLILENISGGIIYGNKSQSYIEKYGISCPLVIPIQEEPPTDRALKERMRYKKNNPR